MSEAAVPLALSTVCDLPFAIDARAVAVFSAGAEVADAAALLDVAAALGLASSSPDRRAARLPGADGELAVLLGDAIEIRPFGPDALRPVPAALADTANRLGWLAVVRDEGRLWLLFDPHRLFATTEAPGGA